MSAGRNTAKRDHHRRTIKAKRLPCHICGEAIDYELPYLHPMEFTVDHVVPLARGGKDVLGNARAAHRSCNRAKSDRMPGDTKQVIKPLTTARSW